MIIQEHLQNQGSGPAYEPGWSGQLKICKHCLRWVLAVFVGLLAVTGWGFIAPTPAGAEADTRLEITGDGVTHPVSFSMEQLQAMEQYEHVYSTINTWPTKRWYVGSGVKLRDLLAIAEIEESSEADCLFLPATVTR